METVLDVIAELAHHVFSGELSDLHDRAVEILTRAGSGESEVASSEPPTVPDPVPADPPAGGF